MTTATATAATPATAATQGPSEPLASGQDGSGQVGPGQVGPDQAAPAAPIPSEDIPAAAPQDTFDGSQAWAVPDPFPQVSGAPVEATSQVAAGGLASLDAPAAAIPAVHPEPSDAGSSFRGDAQTDTQRTVRDDLAALPVRPEAELGSIEGPGDTPQGTSIAPARSVPDRSQGAPRRAASSLKVWLAILGGLAALGALVLPFVLRAGDAQPTPMANAASQGGAYAAISGPSTDDALKVGSGDAGEPDEAQPIKPAVWRVARLADDPTVSLLEGTKGKRTLLAALAASGLSRTESHRVVGSLQDARDVDHMDAKDTFVLARDKATGRVVAFEFADSPVDVWQAREDVAPDGTTRLVTRKLELASERVRVRKAVVVGTDLRASFVEAGFSPIDDVLAMLDDALDGHAELSDLRPGARLRIFATLERIDGAFVRWVSLDAVEYLPASPSAPAVRVYWFGEEDHRHGWYDAKGKQPTHGGFRMPIPLARVVSPFNPHRMHPVLHVVMPHNGVDLRASAGTPVFSTAAGVVVAVGNDGPCGNKVEVSHTGDITSVYCHLSRFAAGLHVGEHIESRQLVGYVGQTGRVTGPHLHFGIKHNGAFIDPMSLRLDGMRVIPRARRDEFDRLRASLDAELDAIPLPASPSADSPAPKEPESETFYEEP